LKAPELAEAPYGSEQMLVTGMLSESLAQLIRIYDQAGRSSDELELIEQAPWWGVTDLAYLEDQYQDLSPRVAKALAEAGRESEAIRILKEYLYGHPEDDAAYQALAEIIGPSLLPWLEELYARDRFEERPLIWKADLLRRQGKLEEAEAAGRQALKVDPTDGEQKAGDRGRGYSVLAEILRARGKAEDAAFFTKVVDSVRLAETGDRFTEAGLIQRSLDLYEKAALTFADAYCVQWRLAERLSAMGNTEEARKHYEIAFERMPEQFGQVASVCFGCEGVFTHQQSRSVADDVLTRLARTSPKKPQVHFLLGQLREAQGRRAEAYQSFRRAAELDPGYVDAWKEAYRLRAEVFLSQQETDDIALRLLRLDPMNRHAGVDAAAISDLKRLWAVYEEAGKSAAPISSRILELRESRSALDALIKRMGGRAEYLTLCPNAYIERRRVPEAGDAVARNNFIRNLVQYMMMTTVADGGME